MQLSRSSLENTVLMSGKVGAAVYCVRHGAMYRRRYVKPDQPDSEAQLRMRTFFGIVSKMAKTVVPESVPVQEVQRAGNRRAGGRIETKPTIRNAVVSVLFRGGVAVERLHFTRGAGKRQFQAMAIDGRSHCISVRAANGKTLTKRSIADGDIFTMPESATELRIDKSPIRYAVSGFES